MKTYQGGCHCRAVRFEIAADLINITECNCSICTKKGVLHHRVYEFRLLSGKEALKLYQFGEKIAKHWFCIHCGIHSFTNPRAAPNKVAVNLRCLDDFHSLRPQMNIKKFDGLNWESAVKVFKFE